MKVDNGVLVTKIQIQKQLYIIIIAAVIAFMFSSDLWDHVEAFLNSSRWLHASVLLSPYLIFYFYHIVVQSTYLHFNDEGKNITIRHYNLSPFSRSKKVYQIPKGQFVGYTVTRSLFGLRESMVVVQRQGAGQVKYSPISITALSQLQKDQLFSALDFYSQH